MNYSGMTVNERLVVSGLFKDFEVAKKLKNKEAIIEILKKIRVNETSILNILNEFGIN
jgi:hypothetical protein